MYTAMEIAQYVINYCIDRQKPISNLKLQKLLYYIQAAFLVHNDRPCFEDNIENWRHGPVVSKVYSEYRKYCNSDICERQTEYYQLVIRPKSTILYERFIFNENCIEDEDKKIINKVVESLLPFGVWDLVERTHQEDPWLCDTIEGEVIKNEYIKKYFNTDGNKKRIYGGFNDSTFK